jgi:hypothetical protein
MALPIPPNTTCDIYRQGNAPPAAPDVAGVQAYLEEHFRNIKPIATGANYTHLLRVDYHTDVRDNFGGGAAVDTVYVPDKNGVAYLVVFVARVARNTPADHKVVYLSRQVVTWPSNNV